MASGGGGGGGAGGGGEVTAWPVKRCTRPAALDPTRSAVMLSPQLGEDGREYHDRKHKHMSAGLRWPTSSCSHQCCLLEAALQPDHSQAAGDYVSDQSTRMPFQVMLSTWRGRGARDARVVADDSHSGPSRDAGVPSRANRNGGGAIRVAGHHHNLASCVLEGGLGPLPCQDG